MYHVDQLTQENKNFMTQKYQLTWKILAKISDPPKNQPKNIGWTPRP